MASGVIGEMNTPNIRNYVYNEFYEYGSEVRYQHGMTR
jgi:hypothetical protein